MQADIDRFLLDKLFQPVAERAAPWGDCFGLARLALAGAVLLQAAVLALDLMIFAEPVARGLAGGIAALAFYAAGQTRTLIAKTARQSRPGLPNVRRISLRWQRTAWLATSVWSGAAAAVQGDAASICAGLTCLCWLAVLYLVSCSPMPLQDRAVT